MDPTLLLCRTVDSQYIYGGEANGLQVPRRLAAAAAVQRDARYGVALRAALLVCGRSGRSGKLQFVAQLVNRLLDALEWRASRAALATAAALAAAAATPATFGRERDGDRTLAAVAPQTVERVAPLQVGIPPAPCKLLPCAWGSKVGTSLGRLRGGRSESGGQWVGAAPTGRLLGLDSFWSA